MELIIGGTDKESNEIFGIFGIYIKFFYIDCGRVIGEETNRTLV